MKITLATCPKCGQEIQEEIAALQLDAEHTFVRFPCNCGGGGVLVLEKEDLARIREEIAQMQPEGRA